MKIFIILTIFFLNCFNLFAQKFFKTSGTPEFEELKKNGLVYIKTGNAIKDSIVEKALRSAWKATRYKIVDQADAINLSRNEIILTEANLTLSDRFGVRSDYLLCLISLKYLNEIDLHKDCIGYMGLNAFNGKSDPTSISFYYEYGLVALNDCVAKIIEKAIDVRIWASYNLVYDEITRNSRKLKDKTLLMVDDGINFVKRDHLDNVGIKYKHVTQKEFEEILKTDASNYCLLFFGGNTTVYDGIIDLSNKSMIYAANYNMGFFGKRDIRRMKKLSGVSFIKTGTPHNNSNNKPLTVSQLDSSLLNKHLVLMSNIVSSSETVFYSSGRIEDKQKGITIQRYIYFEGTNIYLSRKKAREYFKQYPKAYKYLKRSIAFTRIGNWAIVPMIASSVGLIAIADNSSKYRNASVNPKVLLGIGIGVSFIANRGFGFGAKVPLQKAVSKYNYYIDKKNGLQ